MNPRFFRTPAAFLEWLEANHTQASELQVGYYKKATGNASLTWPDSVDEALCFGWIDGIRKRIDEVSYQIRFTPRRPGSTWSRVNIARAQALIDAGRMHAAGLDAYQRRLANTSGIYSYEQRPEALPQPYARVLKRTPAAWAFFRAQPTSYQKTAAWWIVNARKEQTRLTRLEKLAAYSAVGMRLPEFTLVKPAAGVAGPKLPGRPGRPVIAGPTRRVRR